MKRRRRAGPRCGEGPVTLKERKTGPERKRRRKKTAPGKSWDVAVAWMAKRTARKMALKERRDRWKKVAQRQRRDRWKAERGFEAAPVNLDLEVRIRMKARTTPWAFEEWQRKTPPSPLPLVASSASVEESRQ